MKGKERADALKSGRRQTLQLQAEELDKRREKEQLRHMFKSWSLKARGQLFEREVINTNTSRKALHTWLIRCHTVTVELEGKRAPPSVKDPSTKTDAGVFFSEQSERTTSSTRPVKTWFLALSFSGKTDLTTSACSSMQPTPQPTALWCPKPSASGDKDGTTEVWTTGKPTSPASSS